MSTTTHDHGCGHGHHHTHHCFCPPPLSACDGRVALRLAGLRGGLGAHFLRRQGCEAKLTLDCGGTEDTVEGKICDASVDTVSVRSGDKVTTVMLDRIVSVEWDDKDCNPCACHCPCHHKHD